MRLSNKMKVTSILAITSILLMAFSGSPPAGRTGAPGDGTCEDCHGGGSFGASVSWSFNPSSGTEYDWSFDYNITAGSPNRFGWQMVALDDSDNQVGTWTNIPGNSDVTFSGGREYLGHDPSVVASGPYSFNGSWDAQGHNGNVNFYLVGLLANNNGNNGGDNNVLFNTTETVTAPVVINVSFSNVTDVSCDGFTDGSAMAQGSGGTGPYDYEWENGEDTQTAVMLEPGFNSVTATDSNGDSGTAQVFIDEPDPIDLDAFVENVACFGFDDGMIDASGSSGGTGNLDFNWATLGNTCCPDDLPAGEYFLTVTDENGCTDEDSFVVEEPEELTVSLMATDVSMAGATDGTVTADADGGTPGYDYEWSNGDDGSTITGLAAGDYTVTVTDDNDCTVEATATVTDGPCTLMAEADITHVACNGDANGAIIISHNSTIPVTIDWSDGGIGLIRTGLIAGTYNATITDEIGCTVAINNEVQQPDSLAIVTLATPALQCAQDTLAQIIVDPVGGVGDYTLLWSNGVTNDTTINGTDTLVNIPDTLVNLGLGTYFLTLTDGNQCAVFDTFEVINFDSLAPTINLMQATVMLDENGHAPGIGFSAVDNGSFDDCGIESVTFITRDFTCADIGILNFEVILVDTNGNTSTDTASVVVVDEIAPEIVCPPNLSVASCQGILEFPSATATDNCDTPTITQNVGPPSGSMVPHGIYSIGFQALDACGNVSTCSFEVEFFVAELSFETEVTDDDCNPDPAGSITITPVGGTPPFAYFPIGPVATGLEAGDYTIVITDAQGCSYGETITVGRDTELTVSVLNGVICGDTNSGSIQVMIENGTPPYIIDLGVGPEIMSESPQILIEGLPVGTYGINIADSSGCGAFVIGDVEEVPAVMFTGYSIDNMDACSFEPEDILPFLTGGVAPFNYIVANDGANVLGPYSIIVQDSMGCTYQFAIDTLTELEYEPVMVNTSNFFNCPGDDINLVVTGGCPPYEIIQEGLPSGETDIFISDEAGFEVAITVPANRLMPIDTSNVEIIDQDDVLAMVFLDIMGGTPPYTYTWRDQSGAIIGMEEEFSGLITEPQDITLEVIDANGCTATFSFFIDVIVATVNLDKDNQKVKLYPNPVDDRLVLEFINSKPMSYELYDTKGLLINEEKINSSSLILDNLDMSAGLYLIMLDYEDSVIVKTFLKL